MSGQGDERAERILAQAVAKGPRDILGLLRALRRDMAHAIQRREGLVHVFVHRMLRDGRLEAGGQSEAGLVLYRAADADSTPQARVEAREGTDDAQVARTALKISRAVRDPADRGRVLADVRAHLEDLGAVDATDRFGGPKSVAQGMVRVDRGKATVVLPIDRAGWVRRFVLHEGPWILGAAIVFFVLKFFVVSPFVIPSESMLPTLEEGDRVAVFTAFHSGVPDRFDVTVFERGDKFYVKRLIGLPGEDVALWWGDVYIDDVLLERPEWLVGQLRTPVDRWTFRNSAPDGFASAQHDGLVRWWWRRGRFPAHPARVKPKDQGPFGMHDGFVSLTGERASGEVLELLLAHGPAGARVESHGWVLRVDDGGVQLYERTGLELTAGAEGDAPQETLAVEASAPTGALRLELSYVDGRLRARCADFSFEGVRESPGGELSIGLARSLESDATLSLTLDRDHHYSTPSDATHGTPVAGERRGHRVPEDRVYLLGDNTTNSRDSRFSEVADIPVDTIVGPVSIRIWPPNRWGRVR